MHLWIKNTQNRQYIVQILLADPMHAVRRINQLRLWFNYELFNLQ